MEEFHEAREDLHDEVRRGGGRDMVRDPGLGGEREEECVSLWVRGSV